MIGPSPTDALPAHAGKPAGAGGPAVPDTAREATALAAGGPAELSTPTAASGRSAQS
ncbi:hypothetical protein [Streptomyces sp. NPDC093097]|uniref:hypothetical protein n=1 Tax=Streptomyces sp. NPDC093097 TaxID=3366027 RepID=UPI0037FA7443